MMEAVRKHPFLTLVGILIGLWLLWILAGAFTHDTTESAEAAAPAEQAVTDAPGVRSVEVTEPDAHGRYLQIVQGVRRVPESRQRGGEFSTGEVGGYPTGKTNCKIGWEKITLNSIFGTDLANTSHKLYACFDGKRVFDTSATRTCDVTGAGSLAQWGVHAKNTKGWFARWSGFDHGSWHSWLRCEYGQGAFGWQTNLKQHYSEIVIGANGFVNFP